MPSITSLGFTLNRRDPVAANRSEENQVDLTQEIGLSDVNQQLSESSIDFTKLTIEKLFVNEQIGSSNYISGSTGWIIRGNGDVEFNSGIFRGSLIAGEIHIPDQDTTASSFHVGSTGEVWIGATETDKATAPIQITPAGVLAVGSTGGTYVVIDGTAQSVYTSDYIAGNLGRGWSISPAYAEFQNIRARGILKSAIFEMDTVNAVGGSLVVSQSDILDADMAAADAATMITKTEIFPNGTIIRMKDSTNDEWMEVVSTAGRVHTLTRDLAGSYGPDGNPMWRTGTAVVSFAEPGKGFVEINATETNSPFVKIYKRDSATYSDYDTRVLMGNLKDETGVEEYGLWIKGESLYIGGYKQYDIIATKEGAGSTTQVYYAGAIYTSIKAAIDQAETDGETDVTVFVRKGTYTENEEIPGWNLEVTLIGEDKETTIISLGASQAYWRFNKDITIRDLSIAGNTDGVCIVQCIGSDHILIEDCIFTNSFSEANGAGCIYIGDPTDVTDTSVRIRNNKIVALSALTDSPLGAQSAITMNGDRGDVQITNNRIECSSNGIYFKGDATNQQNIVSNNMIGIVASSTLTRGNGIEINGTGLTKTLFNGNLVFVLSGAGDYPIGIHLNGTTSVFQEIRVVNNSVIGAVQGYDLKSAGLICGNNQAKGCTDNGIIVRGDDIAQDNVNTVNNNSVYDCGGDGISIEKSNFDIIGNSIYNCGSGIGDSEVTGTHENVQCIGNQIRDCDNGILIQCSNAAAASNNFIFANNYIAGDSGQTTGVGIGIGSYMNYVTIEGNIIRNFSVGIDLQQRVASAITYLNIVNNDIDDMNSLAISLQGQTITNIKIINNRVFDGVTLQNLSAASEVNDNHINGANGLAILADVRQAKIMGNHIEASTNNAILITTDLYDGSIISNNRLRTTNAAAVCLKIDDDMYDSIVSDNWMDSALTCIRIADQLDDSVFEGNWLQYDAAGYGIQVIGDVDTSTSENEGTVISGNNIKHDDTTGATECIYMAANVRNLTVTGNRLYGGGSGNYVITIVGTTHYCLFVGNRNSHGLAAGTIGAGIQGTGARTGNVQANNIIT